MEDPAWGFWHPAWDDPSPWVAVRLGEPGEQGQIVDRVWVACANAATRAVDYRLQVQSDGAGWQTGDYGPGPWEDVVVVRDNPDVSRVHELPEDPRVGGASLRLLVERTPGDVAPVVTEFRAERCLTPPLSRALRVGGAYTYTARAWGPAGDAGELSEPLVVDAPLTDLAVDASGLVLSEDEVFVGDLVFLVVPVDNLGLTDVDVAQAVLVFHPEEGEPEQVAEQTFAAEAQSETALVLPWLVTSVRG